MRITAVVPNWNGGTSNVDCLSSLEAQGLEPRDIVFVDNGSDDGSRELVEQRWPGAHVVKNLENRGFAAAANQGIQIALERGADAVFLVNNDLEVSPGTLQRLTKFLEEHPSVGICGPRLLMTSRPGTLWCAGGSLTWRQNLSTLNGHDQPDGEQWKVARAVDYVPGCAMLVSRDVFEEVGLFDASFFAYMEDIDLCLRARERGFEVWVVGEVSARHEPSLSTGGGYSPRRKYMMGVNSIWFVRRYASPSQWLKFIFFDVCSLPFVWARRQVAGQGRAVLAKALGIYDGLRGRHVTAESIEPDAHWLWKG